MPSCGSQGSILGLTRAISISCVLQLQGLVGVNKAVGTDKIPTEIATAIR